MRIHIGLAMLAAIFLNTAALADAGHSHDEQLAYGEPGDPAKPARKILIAMRESAEGMQFVPNEINIKAGEQVRFVIRNNGELDHEMVFATLEANLKHGEEMAKNPDMEHDDPNAARVAPKQVQEIVWKFTNTGEFDFSCLIPGHREAGMFGKIVVR